MYIVYDNGKFASSHGQNIITPGHGWDNHAFQTFEEARDYAQLYLGCFDLPEDWDGSPYCYYLGGNECTIEIREEGQ